MKTNRVRRKTTTAAAESQSKKQPGREGRCATKAKSTKPAKLKYWERRRAEAEALYARMAQMQPPKVIFTNTDIFGTVALKLARDMDGKAVLFHEHSAPDEPSGIARHIIGSREAIACIVVSVMPDCLRAEAMGIVEKRGAWARSWKLRKARRAHG